MKLNYLDGNTCSFFCISYSGTRNLGRIVEHGSVSSKVIICSDTQHKKVKGLKVVQKRSLKEPAHQVSSHKRNT